MEIVKIFIIGVVTIGTITALFGPGKSTVSGINAIGKQATGLLNTAEKG